MKIMIGLVFGVLALWSVAYWTGILPLAGQ